MFTHAPRVTRSYADISASLLEWVDRSTVAIICQHDADAKVKQTHVHLGLWGCDVQAEALKRMFIKKSGLKLSGNEDWKWKYKRFPAGLPPWEEPVTTPAGLIIPGKGWDQNFQYLVYCIKGDLSRVKYSKNISQDILERARDAWIDPVKDGPTRTEVHIEHVKVRSPPYQQTVIMDATVEWLNYKKEHPGLGYNETRDTVIMLVCNAMRKCSKGINPHMVRDLSYAVLYDDADWQDLVLKRCRNYF